MSYELRTAVSLPEFTPRIPFCVFAWTLIPHLAFGQGAVLKIGDPAPPIAVAQWIHGPPTDDLARGQVYVVEFWATWCGPCRRAIRHLTELQRRFGSKLTVIAVSTWEPDWRAVPRFVAREGAEMGYRVATDRVSSPSTPDGEMSHTWMAAGRQGEIPAAFLVDGEGRIAWIGLPTDLDGPITQLLSGTWDREHFARAYEIEADRRGRVDRFQRAFSKAVKARDWSAANSVLDRAPKEVTRKELDWQRLGLYRLAGDDRAFSMVAGRLIKLGPAACDFTLLNFIAWTIVDPKGPFVRRDVRLALRAAAEAVRLSGRAPDFVDTLAWGYYWSGNRRRAVLCEKEALAGARVQERGEFRRTLKRFINGGGSQSRRASAHRKGPRVARHVGRRSKP